VVNPGDPHGTSSRMIFGLPPLNCLFLLHPFPVSMVQIPCSRRLGNFYDNYLSLLPIFGDRGGF
jgi:hypothetical protein